MALTSGRRALMGAVGGTALLGLALTGCTSDETSSTEDEVLNAIMILDGAGLHGIDDAINVDGEVPANGGTVARKMQAVMAITEWPSDLEDSAEELEGVFAEMASTLGADEPDVEASGAIAARAHDVEHDFSGAVWEYLYDEAGIEAGGGGHD